MFSSFGLPCNKQKLASNVRLEYEDEMDQSKYSISHRAQKYELGVWRAKRFIVSLSYTVTAE